MMLIMIYSKSLGNWIYFYNCYHNPLLRPIIYYKLKLNLYNTDKYIFSENYVLPLPPIHPPRENF